MSHRPADPSAGSEDASPVRRRVVAVLLPAFVVVLLVVMGLVVYHDGGALASRLAVLTGIARPTTAERQLAAVQVIERFKDSTGVRAASVELPPSERWLSVTGAVVYIQTPRLHAVYFPDATGSGGRIGDYYVLEPKGAPPGGGPWDSLIGEITKVDKLSQHWWQGAGPMEFDESP